MADYDQDCDFPGSPCSAMGDPCSNGSVYSSSSRKRCEAARRVIEFIVPNVGGGFIAVDSIIAGHCAGGIRVGGIGKQYAKIADARKDAQQLAHAMTGKCKGNKLDFGGCKTVLYFLDVEQVTSAMEVGSPRALLFNGLAEALAPVIGKILCGPDMNTTFRDLAYLRARCCQLYPTMTKNPIPHEMTTESSLVATATAYGLYGALATLAKKKGWVRPTAVIQGMGAVGGRVYDMLLEDGWTLYAGDFFPKLLEHVPEAFRLTGDEIFCEPCDVFVPCAMGGVLSLPTIEKLQCKAVAGCANLQIPVDTMPECKIALSNRGIEYYDEVLLNGGGVQSAIFAFRCEKFVYEDSVKMCSRNMDVMVHEQSVVTQYDTAEQRMFYATVMGDGTDSIHFGLWDGVDLEMAGAYAEASMKMTEYMWQHAMQRTARPMGEMLSFIDLGAGSGCAARHIADENPSVHATCLNLCPNQNAQNRQRVAEMGLDDRVMVVDGTFECMPNEWTAMFDGAFSQDSFVHAFSKQNALAEALRIVKGGGWLVVSDVHCGDGVAASEAELQNFAETNMVNDWMTPDAMVEAAREVGWVDVQFVDLTAHIKTSFQLMLKKVTDVLASGQHEGMNLSLLETYRTNLARRDVQIDLGVFKWGALFARKPFEVFFATPSEEVVEAPSMVKLMPHESDITSSVDVVVLTPEADVDIDLLPASTQCIISMGEGLDHIDGEAAEVRDIIVQQAATLGDIPHVVLSTLDARHHR